MSAATSIEDENSVREAQEAETSNRDAPTISEGMPEPSFHKATLIDAENSGKAETTPSKQSVDEALAIIDNADAINRNNKCKTPQQLDQDPTDLENIVKSSGDYVIQSKNTITGIKDDISTETTSDLLINAEKIDKNEETTATKIIAGDVSPAKATDGDKTDDSRPFIDDKSVNDDVTPPGVSNDIIEDIEPSSQCVSTKTNPVTTQVNDCNETSFDMKIDNEDDDLELKWDDGNDDDLLKDDMECDAGNEEHAETLADESSMDIDFDEHERDVLNDNPTVDNENNDVNSTIGDTIQNTDSAADENVKNDEITEVINENVIETDSNTLINENKDVKVLNEPQEGIGSHDNDEISSSHDLTMEDSDLIKKDHGVHRPDVMLEIPTQELIDIDDTDLSINLDQSDEKLMDNNKMTEAEPTVSFKEVELTGDTNTQDNTKDLKVNITKKVFDGDSEDPIQPSKSSVGYKTAIDTLEILPDVTDSSDTCASPEKITNKELDVTDTEAIVSHGNLDDVAKISSYLNPGSGKEDTEVSSSTNPAPSDDLTEDSTDMVPKLSDTDPETPDDGGTSSTKITPDSSNLLPETLENINTVATTSNAHQMPENLDILETCNKISIESSQAVSEMSDNVTQQAAASNMTVKMTENRGTIVSSLNITLETSTKASDPSTALQELSASSESMGIPVSVALTAAPELPLNPEPSNDLLQATEKVVSSVSPNEMIPDTSDELPEVSDSLGLLAESSRVLEDDDYQEDDEDADADDDDDFDQDESSNQLTTADHSEDSNAQQSETEANRDEKETDISPPVESEREFQFMISNVESQGTDNNDMECIEAPVEEVVVNNVEPIEDIGAPDEVIGTLDEKQQVTDEQADIETVRLSDTSDTEADTVVAKPTGEQPTSITTEKIPAVPSEQSKQSPSKTRNLQLSTSAQPVFNIVDLEESSSEDDIQEINKEPETVPEVKETDGVTSVNLPNDIEVMCTSAGSTSEIVTKEGEVVISGVPKPPPIKPARLNTGEVSIKTAGAAGEPTLVIPEAKASGKDTLSKEARVKPKLCLEIFSLDSDEDDASSLAKEVVRSPSPPAPAAVEAAPLKCINPACSSGPHVPRAPAPAAARLHYGGARRGRALVCQTCAGALHVDKQNLIRGIKEFCPLLELGADKLSQELVEISDSESEDETEEPKPPSATIGEKGAKLLEENLAAIINETWRRYNMDARLKDTTDILDAELQKLENDSKEIDEMLNECQMATDKLRNELYGTFERDCEELPPHLIYDTPMYSYVGPEIEKPSLPPLQEPLRQSKRRMSTAAESPAKKPAIPLGYTPLDSDSTHHNIQDSKTAALDIDSKIDDDKEVAVVRLSAEAAPADLPPAGGAGGAGGPGAVGPRPPLRPGAAVFAMRNAFGPWLRAKVLECQPKLNMTSPFTMCRVKFDHKVKNACKILSARCLAYPEPAEVRMTIGTRVIALYKDPSNLKREQFFSGVVAEIPNPVNNYRYLVFFDDGYAQYVQHSLTRLVCESSSLVWEEVHPFSRQFVKDYLMSYPERPMVRLHEGQNLKTEWNGKWWSSRVLVVDASLAQVLFLEDGRKEWIYRGSTRLAPLYLEFQAAGRHRQRPMPRSKAATGTNMPYVEYTRSDEQDGNKQQDIQTQQQQNEELRRQRAVARKSTAAPPPAPAPPHQNLDTVTSRVVYYTPKAAVKPYKMVPHTCGPRCKRSDVLSLKELRTYNPLAKPLLSGWERQIVRYKGHKEVMYRAPCGRRLRDMRELHRYLRITQSELPVDLFDFYHGTHCLAEFVLNKCLVGKKDLSHGKENVPVPCVNYYDDSLPEFCSYNTERTPTAGVPLNLDPEFLCGCDCTDDCMDKSKCACWRMTLEGARTIGLEVPNVGYVYKRLPEPLPSGIYECNSRCKCKATCLNRVAQHPLQLKLQVFKTLNRGWGIRALNDIPKGAFLCVYAGNLLTDATANLDGLNEGDEYLAELDYIEVVEQMKEGYEEDIPAADKRLDKREGGKQREAEEEETSSAESSEEEARGASDKEDGDFWPGYIGLGLTEFNKALRKRDKAKRKEDYQEKQKEKGKDREKEDNKNEEDCITISDDEEVREPSRFTAQAGMGANQFISKYRSVRAHFGKDEACYIMDAKVQGNIGRYLNHSCTPNVFVQNVFVDTHDPRFPWVAFFALSHIRAGTELTWNYNYDVGSVPGKVLYCFCGAPNCRGRLL